MNATLSTGGPTLAQVPSRAGSYSLCIYDEMETDPDSESPCARAYAIKKARLIIDQPVKDVVNTEIVFQYIEGMGENRRVCYNATSDDGPRIAVFTSDYILSQQSKMYVYEVDAYASEQLALKGKRLFVPASKDGEIIK